MPGKNYRERFKSAVVVAVVVVVVVVVVVACKTIL